MYFLNENYFAQNCDDFFAEGSTDNKSARVQIMAWFRTGDKPLFEPTMALFTDAYIRHSASMRNIK